MCAVVGRGITASFTTVASRSRPWPGGTRSRGSSAPRTTLLTLVTGALRALGPDPATASRKDAGLEA